MVTVSCSEPKEDYPSFFKVVRNPCAPHLSLPNAFVRKYLDKIPKHPILKTATGEHSWRLKIIKTDENYCFTHGWDKLVKDVQLCIRDIVVFWLIDPFTFQVTFLDANGCQKDLPLKISNDDGHNNGDGDGDDDDDDENLCFEKVISRKTHKYYMSLPRKFVGAAGLEYKTSTIMKDHEGKEWIMGILAERYARTKHSLSKGWLTFRKYHQLSDGDVCLFKFNKKEGVLNLVQVIKSRRPIKQENHRKETTVKVKIEDECLPIEKPCGGVKVKIDDGSGQVEVVKRMRGRLPVERLGGGGGGGHVEVKIESETERLVRSKHVVYF